MNVFYRINQEKYDWPEADVECAKQEREFKSGSIGLVDSAGILMASLLAVPTEISCAGRWSGRARRSARTCERRAM